MLEEKALAEKTFAAEKNVAGTRVLTIIFGGLVYLGLMDRSETRQSLALAILASSLAYSMYVYFFQPYRRYPILISGWATTVTDTIFITVWLWATGGVLSPFHPLYTLSVMGVAFRFRPMDTFITAGLYAASYVGLVLAGGGFRDHLIDVVTRIGYLFLMAAVGAALSRETLRQIRAKLSIRGLARNLSREGRRRDLALAASESRFHDMVQSLNALFWEFDLATRKYLFISPRAEQLLGYSLERWMADPEFWFQCIHSEDRDRIVSCYNAAILESRDQETEYRVLTSDGRQLWLQDTLHIVKEGRHAKKIRGMMVDITTRKEAEAKIRHQSYHDALTGLPNRALFVDRLSLALAQAKRRNQQLAVLVIDLDRFKTINDSLGYTAGDEILRAVAERLKSRLHEGDTVARLGGDEFTLLLPHIESTADAAKAASALIESLKSSMTTEGHDLHVTATVGISVFPTDGEDAESLLKNAATSAYDAKERGRSHYRFYTPSLNAKAFEQLSLENSLRRALDRGEFSLHYQPQVELGSGKITGSEALLRWKHPDMGLVSPAEFIGLAEETGLIIPIGEWALHTACAQAQKWRKSGKKVRLSVNLSARQFQQENITKAVARALDESGLDAEGLGLEITESIAMSNADYTIRTLKELHSRGVAISLDDFGTGYSSLAYLKLFPLHELKIDKSFVRDLGSDPNDEAIASAVIALAHNMRLKVLAEGVETEEQLRFLKSKSCDLMQGYLYSRPLPAEEFEKLFSREENQGARQPK